MGPYYRDGGRRSPNERDGYSRRSRDDDEEFHFRGASTRDRGERRDYGSRDRPRRPYNDRDYSDDRRGHQYHSSSSDRHYGGGWSDRDYVVREPTPPPQRPNGDDNVASESAPPSQVLLIRRLKASSNRQVLIKGLNKKLCREADESDEDASALGATPGSLRGVYFICDKQDDTCLSFAFAEFHSVADARAALRKSNYLGDLCTVSSQRFLVDYANFNAFPVADSHEKPINTFQLAEDIPVRLRRAYRDVHYYVSFEPVNIEPPEGYKVRTEQDVAGNSNTEPLPAPQTTTSTSINLSLKKRPSDYHGADKANEPKAKKPKPETSLGPQFATWSRKQAELRADVAEESETEPSGDAVPPTARAAPRQSFLCAVSKASKDQAASDSVESVEQTEQQASSAICFLCGTHLPLRYASVHVRQGRTHQERLQDTARLDKAYALMQKLNLAPEHTIKIQLQSLEEQYVDRAKLRRKQEKRERREMREKAKAEPAFKMSLNSGEGNLSSGLGASMLKKHGWNEGSGLGSGDGRIAPIEQTMFASGVGIGHVDSNKGDALEHANKATRGESDTFADKTMESARQRFRDLSRS